MNTYEVEIRENLARVVKVEAVSEDAAIEKVEEDYKNGKIVLDANDFVEKEVEVINTLQKCRTCKQLEDEDGRCSCTNKDAN